ncbi:unnamed protein product [Camellia sinensis]
MIEIPAFVAYSPKALILLSNGNCVLYMISTKCSFEQQVCNAVAVARLLNATLVVSHLLYSSVWRDLR